MTLALISVWQFVGIPMMLIYAALLNIPDELVDAARVDGLGQFRIFWHIKLPLVLPTIGTHLDPDLRRQFQRVRSHLFSQGRARRAELRLRHSRHVLLSHVLRQPVAARRSDDGRDGGDGDVLHHPGRRVPLSVPRAAPHAPLRLLGTPMFNQRAPVVGVHAILIAYSALAVGPILLVVMNSFKIAQRHLRRAARAAERATFSLIGYAKVLQGLAHRDLFHEFADRHARQHGPRPVVRRDGGLGADRVSVPRFDGAGAVSRDRDHGADPARLGRDPDHDARRPASTTR